MSDMQTYYAFWLTGNRESLPGESVGDALTRAGYSRGALGALDFITSDPRSVETYVFDATARRWVAGAGDGR